MKVTHDETKTNLLNRLRRLEGQINGVKAMIESERDCEEILQQLSAVNSAVKGVTQIFLSEMMEDCLTRVEDSEIQVRRETADRLSRLVMHYRA